MKGKVTRGLVRRSLVLALGLLAGGCATLTAGPTEQFRVDSTPEGASVSSTTGWTCITPCSVSIARRGDFVVTVRKEGFLTRTVWVDSVRAPARRPRSGVQVNTGMVGGVTDWLSGANYEHRPNPLQVTLEPER